MTRDEILAIPVGPALDRLVAERVLLMPPCDQWVLRYTKDDVWGDAWHRKDSPGECPHDWKRGWPGGCFPAADWRDASPGGEYDLPLSTSHDEAMRLVEATGSLPHGWVWVLQTMREGVLGHFASVGYPKRSFDSKHAHAEAEGATFPEAICRAALLAAADQEALPSGAAPAPKATPKFDLAD
jgi:hypothetical protein